MNSIEKLVYDNVVLPIVKIDGNDKVILEEDYEKIKLSAKEREFLNYLLMVNNIEIKKELITKNDRENLVKDYEYGEKMTYGLSDRDVPVYSEVEFDKFGNVRFADYKELEKFLEEEFIPLNIDMKRKKNTETGDYDLYPSIQLNKIVKLRFSEVEVKAVLKYLDKKGIRVGGTNHSLDSEFENYDYLRNYKNIMQPESLTKEETFNKFALYKEFNDPVVREQIIMGNMRLVPYLVYRYAKNYGVDHYELEQYGYEGLIEAVDKFDYKKGYSFFTYAKWYIRSAIWRGLLEQELSMGIRQWYFLNAIKEVEDDSLENIGDNPKLARDVVQLLIDQGYVSSDSIDYNIQKILVSKPVSLDEMIENDQDIISNDIETSVLGERDSVSEGVLNLLDVLSPIQKQIIIKKFGLDGEKPKLMKEIVEEFNLSASRIGSLYRSAINKLRRPAENVELSYYESTLYGNDSIEEIHDVYKSR